MKKNIRFSAGFTLIEVIVGMMITLIASLIIFQVLAISEGHKRTTTGGSDSLQSGSYATYTLNRMIQMSGSGYATLDSSIYGCPLRFFYNGTQLTGSNAAYNNYPTPFKSTINTAFAGRSIPYSLPVSPVLIVDGGNSSDTIITFSGHHPNLTTKLKPTSVDSSSNIITFNNNNGLVAGDLLMLLDMDSSLTVPTCDVVQVSTTDETTTKIVNSTGFTSSTGLANYSQSTVIAPLGKAPTVGGSAPSYPYPILFAYTVGSDGDSSNALLQYDILRNDMRSIADNIFYMKAIYGVAANSTDQSVDSWIDASTTGWTSNTITADNIVKIRAVRIGFIVRNNVKEKEKPIPSLTKFTLFSDTAVSKSINVNTANQYYRYKTFDITIPLRNMILMTKNL